MEKKIYDIPIVWESYKRYTVEANSLQEAVNKAIKQFLDTSDDNYLDDSFSIDNYLKEEHPHENYNLHESIEEYYKNIKHVN